MRTTCRTCGAALTEVLDLGAQYPVCFPLPGSKEKPELAPLTLMLCENRACGLVQLSSTVPAESLDQWWTKRTVAKKGEIFSHWLSAAGAW